MPALKKDPRIKDTVVRSVLDITPNMRRVVLGGPDLADFPKGQEGGYIKLRFYEEDSDTPTMRTYSIGAHNVETGELTVDFALHAASGGLAMDWVMQAKPGDTLEIAGPGPVKMAPAEADWYLIAADMTGLPAALCNLEMLPDTAKGYAVLEIPTEADKQDVSLPDGITLHWVINPTPQALNNKLLNKITSLDWHIGAPFVWTACEFDTMRALRSYYRVDRAVDKKSYYLSSYWRAGRTETQHKTDKRKFVEKNGA